MATESAYERLQSLYDGHMWIDTFSYEKAEERIESDNLDADGVSDLFNQNSKTLIASFERDIKRASNWMPYYACLKKVFLAGSSDDIVLAPRYAHQRLTGTYRAEISSYYDYEYKVGIQYAPYSAIIEASNNRITIPYSFGSEDKYTVRVFMILSNGDETPFLTTAVYAVAEDLYHLKYYKADLHMHTIYSDGLEEPQLTAAYARASGMDVIAITDHNHIEGSIKGRKVIAETEANMTVILGEEYALEYSPMHILSYGLEKPIDRVYLKRWIENSPELDKFIHDDIVSDPLAYACTQLLLEKVHDLGGITILAHPYWKPPASMGGRVDTPERLFRDLAKRRQFDGVELVSGSPIGQYSGSISQHLLEREMMGDFEGIPVIGITDSHRYTVDPISGKHFTVLFARSRSEEDVLTALQKGNCVAVEKTEGDSLVYGTLRYVKFAYFLLEHYFPIRDQIARKEGIQLLMDQMNPDIIESALIGEGL